MLSHFLFHCSSVKRFWSSLCNWSAQQIDVSLDIIDVLEYILGVPKEHPRSRVINFILLLCKFYIYCQKLFHDAMLDLTAFQQELRMKLKMEKNI